jgi:hypothetical protein
MYSLLLPLLALLASHTTLAKTSAALGTVRLATKLYAG